MNVFAKRMQMRSKHRDITFQSSIIEKRIKYAPKDGQVIYRYRIVNITANQIIFRSPTWISLRNAN